MSNLKLLNSIPFFVVYRVQISAAPEQEHNILTSDLTSYLISSKRFLSLSFCIWDAQEGTWRNVTPTAFLPRLLSTSSTIDSLPAVMTMDFGLIGDWLHVRFDAVPRDWLIVEQSRSLCRLANDFLLKCAMSKSECITTFAQMALHSGLSHHLSLS